MTDANLTPEQWEEYADYILKQAVALLAIDSPTGYTQEAAEYVQTQLSELGFETQKTHKGGVICDFGGTENGILLETHLDTLGGMVCEIKDDGRLKITPLGGLNANNVETENVKVITKFNGSYDGTVQLCNASVHVNGAYSGTPRSFDSVEVVLDEDVRSADDVKALGVRIGDIVCVNPRTVITPSGYIKSRFLDDKLSVAILLGYAKYLKDTEKIPARHVFGHITVFEEVSYGGSASVPEGIVEGLSIDMGCVGQGLTCNEKQVSICAKDSHGPYHYDVVKGLIEAAEKIGADYAVDVYPFYGSDVEATLRAGWDLKHGLIGAGVYASHGYERSHREGALNTLKLLVGYIG